MKPGRLLLPIALLWTAAGMPGAAAVSDTTAPELLSMAFSPDVVNTSIDSQAIQFTVRLRDDLSGFNTSADPMQWTFAGATASFVSAAGSDWNQVRSVSFSPYMRSSGDFLDGVYTNTLVMPRFSCVGTWILTQFTVSDTVGNRRQLSLAQVRSRGFPTEFTVQGTEDLDAPELLSASITPQAVDTSDSRRPITVSSRILDLVAGMDAGASSGSVAGSFIYFSSPSRQQSISASFGAVNRASGDTYNGVYTNTLWVSRYSEPGEWYLDYIVLIDAVGNQRRIDLAEALDRGLPAHFTVQGPGDTQPPELRMFEISPQRIDTSTAAQAIAFRVRLVDRLSGMRDASVPYGYSSGFASVSFQSPSRNQSASVAFGPWMRASGTDSDGVYTNTLMLPRFSETGVWTLRNFGLKDAAGNSTNLASADLQPLGFPTQFAVGVAPALKLARSRDSLVLSWPAWATSYSLESCREPGQSATWTSVGLTPILFSDDAVVVLPISPGCVFYRLTGPP